VTTTENNDATTATQPVTFESLGVDADLIAVLNDRDITAPFPIQELTIPDALAGSDITGKAETGSGKTLAFGLPMVQQMERARKGAPHGLVLVPTRELANQVALELEPLLAAKSLRLASVYGGASMGRQIDRIGKGVEIIVATPGRLIDLLERKVVKLDAVAQVTIDEADQMADMGFLPQVRRIMRHVSDEHQTMLFSATLDGQVGSLISAYMSDPVEHEVDTVSQAIDTMEQRFLKVHYMDKIKVTAAIAEGARRTLVFVRTKHACDKVAREVRAEGVGAKAIHGDLPQRKREEALDSFARGRTPVLVATNVAARGLHVDGVDVVVHYDPPDDPKTYLHRSGRTARAGESGLVVTLVEWDQVNEVIGIQRRAGLNLPIVKMFSNDPRLADLASWQPDEKPPMQNRTAGTAAAKTKRRRRRI
jgi:superfamily II DNA/RNA helicase